MESEEMGSECRGHLLQQLVSSCHTGLEVGQ